MTDDEWANLFAGAKPPHRATAQTFVQRYRTFSQPVLLQCDAGLFVVKGQQVGRESVMSHAVLAEHVVAGLGREIGAPIPASTTVVIPQELIAAEREMADYLPGEGFGSQYVASSPRLQVTAPRGLVDHDAYCRLAALWSWCHGDDPQAFRTEVGDTVISVDHGHFFPGGPNWTAELLQERAEAGLHNSNVYRKYVGAAEFAVAVQAVKQVSDSQLAGVIASAPLGLDVPQRERFALAEFLRTRRDRL